MLLAECHGAQSGIKCRSLNLTTILSFQNNESRLRLAKFTSENVELFHRSIKLMKIDDFESFRAFVHQLEPDDREEVLQMYKKAYHYVKTGNPNMPALE